MHSWNYIDKYLHICICIGFMLNNVWFIGSHLELSDDIIVTKVVTTNRRPRPDSVQQGKCLLDRDLALPLEGRHQKKRVSVCSL
jgi:hypothetical protein